MVFAARRVSTLTLLILGVLVGYAASALVSILLRLAAPENVQSYVIWTLGEFAGVSWGEAAILAPALLVGLLMAAVAVKPLNALLLGETYARSMGVRSSATGSGDRLHRGPRRRGDRVLRPDRIPRHRGASPRARLFQTSDHRVLVPGTALLGASLALLADVLTQLPGGSRRCRSTPSPRSSARRCGVGDPGAPPSVLRRRMTALVHGRSLAVGYRLGRDRELRLIDGADFELEAGELVCLLGPNGSGKSTLLRTIAGMQRPLAGSVELLGHDVRSRTPEWLARHISIVLTEPIDAGALTARELVGLGRYPFTDWLGRLTAADRARVDAAMRRSTPPRSPIVECATSPTASASAF